MLDDFRHIYSFFRILSKHFLQQINKQWMSIFLLIIRSNKIIIIIITYSPFWILLYSSGLLFDVNGYFLNII
jgi:hypothetical protein